MMMESLTRTESRLVMVRSICTVSVRVTIRVSERVMQVWWDLQERRRRASKMK